MNDSDLNTLIQAGLSFPQTSTLISPTFQRGVSLEWKRTDGILYTNVKWIVRHHSPDGFEIGYAGSGPADLALNIMAELYPVLAVPENVQRKEKCWDGTVSHRAWILHQPFKFRFLIDVDRNRGLIEWAIIAEWLDSQKAKLAKD